MLRSWRSALKGLLVAVMLTVQTVSLAHAAEHGEHPHEHDGVECAFTIPVAEDIAIFPVPPISVFLQKLTGTTRSHVLTKLAGQWPPERGSPPRSPPFNQS